MSNTDDKPLSGLADAQQRSQGTLSYRIGQALAEPLALLALGTVLLLAAWKAAELIELMGVL